MKPMVAGILAAAAIIVAFVAGMQIEYMDDSALEELGEATEDVAEEASGG